VYREPGPNNEVLIYNGFHRIVAATLWGDTEIDTILFPLE